MNPPALITTTIPPPSYPASLSPSLRTYLGPEPHLGEGLRDAHQRLKLAHRDWYRLLPLPLRLERAAPHRVADADVLFVWFVFLGGCWCVGGYMYG